MAVELREGQRVVMELLNATPREYQKFGRVGHAIDVLVDGKEDVWFISEHAFKRLKELIGEGSWEGKKIAVIKKREGDITRVEVELVKEEAQFPPTVSIPPTPSPATTLVGQVTHIQPEAFTTMGEIHHYQEPYVSISLSRTSKGVYSWEVKITGYSEDNVLKRIKELNAKLLWEFGETGQLGTGKEEGNGAQNNTP